MSESIDQVREKAASITARINSDAAFKAQVVEDPEATLVAAGLSTDAIPDFLAEAQNPASSEVSGYMLSDCTITCILTSCSLSIL